jgi:D-amino-acid dehydrogenase
MNARDPDILILGGGVIGLACAHSLLVAGRSVEIVEQATVGAGASHGNCGTLTPSHAAPLAAPGMVGKALRMMFEADAPFHVRPRLDVDLLGWMLRFARRCNAKDFRGAMRPRAELLLRSRELIERLVADEGLDCGFEAVGTLSVYRDARVFERAQWLPEALAEAGVRVDVLDGAAACRLEPALREGLAGAFLNTRDAHLRPDRYVSELARRVRERGGIIHERERVTGLRTEGGRVAGVATSGGERRGRDVVCALGAWSSAFGRELGLAIPLQPGKGYSITYERPALCPRIPLTLKERSVCVTAWNDGFRLGSTMEFAGYDATLNRRRLDALVRGAGEYLTEPVGPRIIEEWYGWRPMTWDEQPIIGRVPRCENLVLATGHGMLGVTLSAITGLLVSEILCGRPPSLDPRPYSPARFPRCRR